MQLKVGIRLVSHGCEDIILFSCFGRETALPLGPQDGEEKE
jgi:hypothetical protein